MQNYGRKVEELNQLYENIKKIITYTITTGKNKLDKRNGMFELLGCDILVDEQLQPFLLEINTNPAIFLDTPV